MEMEKNDPETQTQTFQGHWSKRAESRTPFFWNRG